MSRLTRYTQQIFASTAGADEIAEYGSFAASAPQFYSGSTITPAIVQALGNYLSGWFSAVEGSYSPAIEDMNALCYLFAYQLTYILEAGLPEWDSGTTYSVGDLAQDGTGTLYTSLTNSNLNHALTDSTNWFAFPQAGVLTKNALPYTAGMTLPANETMMWPNMIISSGKTVTVPNNAHLIGFSSITIQTGGNLTVTGTGNVRII